MLVDLFLFSTLSSTNILNVGYKYWVDYEMVNYICNNKDV